MAPSDSTTDRPGPTRSVAPTMATERGLTRGSSCIYGPFGGSLAKEQGDEHAEQNRPGEQGRYHGDHRIGFEADRFEHLLGQSRGVATGNEDRHYRLVERVQECEQGADQDPGPQHR